MSKDPKAASSALGADAKLGGAVDPRPDEARARAKWPFVVASLVGLIGAYFGGVYGSLVAAFAGDSWWTSSFALSCFQYATAIGGVCVGAVPGLVWLCCLGQRWVWPILGAGTGALLLPILERMSLGNTTMGFLYAGVVVAGFLVGLLVWLGAKRRAN